MVAGDLLGGLWGPLYQRASSNPSQTQEKFAIRGSDLGIDKGSKPVLWAGRGSQAFPSSTPPLACCQRLPNPKMVLPIPPPPLQFTSFCLGLEEAPVLPTQLANLFFVSPTPKNEETIDPGSEGSNIWEMMRLGLRQGQKY